MSPGPRPCSSSEGHLNATTSTSPLLHREVKVHVCVCVYVRVCARDTESRSDKDRLLTPPLCLAGTGTLLSPLRTP